MAEYLVIFLICIPLTQAAQRLDTFTIDKSEISVSGMSSGAAMAVQFHVGYSGSLKGVGSFAGIPYHCSEANLSKALGPCMSSPSALDVAPLVSYTRTEANLGKIDPLYNFRNTKIFIWSGTNDTAVSPGLSKKLETYYEGLVDSPSQIKAVYTPGANHNFPTETYGNPCSTFGSPYIGKCNFNGAFEMLNFIHGNLKRPASQDTQTGKLLTFGQKEFFPTSSRKRFLLDSFLEYEHAAAGVMGTIMGGMMGGMFSGMLSASAHLLLGPSFTTLSGNSKTTPHILTRTTTSGMDDVGFVYIPSGCFDSTVVCRLHVVYHGCQMQREVLGDTFVKHAGYNEVGEVNNIIILYPQIKADNSSNPNGCWDWFGYTGIGYDTKDGRQMKATMNMIDRLTGVSP